MNWMKKTGVVLKKIPKLFWTMFKIGLFTFGGGYAMIALLENELVSRKKWLKHGEFMDMVAIAESTPGPVAVNAATYVGYQMAGVLGALLSTIAVCIPSFAIIFAISLFFNTFLEISVIAAAFQGIRVGVVFLILTAGLKLFKKLPKTGFNFIVLFTTLACMLFFGLFAIDFTSVFYILISAALGVCVYLIGLLHKRRRERK